MKIQPIIAQVSLLSRNNNLNQTTNQEPSFGKLNLTGLDHYIAVVAKGNRPKEVNKLVTEIERHPVLVEIKASFKSKPKRRTRNQPAVAWLKTEDRKFSFEGIDFSSSDGRQTTLPSSKLKKPITREFLTSIGYGGSKNMEPVRSPKEKYPGVVDLLERIIALLKIHDENPTKFFASSTLN